MNQQQPLLNALTTKFDDFYCFLADGSNVNLVDRDCLIESLDVLVDYLESIGGLVAGMHYEVPAQGFLFKPSSRLLNALTTKFDDFYCFLANGGDINLVERDCLFESLDVLVDFLEEQGGQVEGIQYEELVYS